MANDTKKKPAKAISPAGVFAFPKLSKPGLNFNKDKEVYEVTLIMDEANMTALRSKLAPALAAAIEAGQAEYDKLPINTRKKVKFTPQEEIGQTIYDEKTEQPTGDFKVKFARTASGVSKKTGKPWAISLPIFDAQGTPMKNVEVWGGTKGKVSFEYDAYFVPGTGVAGLSLRLVAVQVLELRTKGQESADSFGFDKEDGFEYDPSDFAADPEVNTSAADGDDTPDF